MIKDVPIQAFLQDLASATPTPGGGSAAAIMGAMGSALVSMVANLTLGKRRYQQVEAEMKTILARAEKIRTELVAAIQQDIDAFDQVMAAYRLPKETEAEQTARSARIQQALKTATDIPLKCARLSVETIDLSLQVAAQGNRNLISDAAVAALVAHAALKSSAINVWVNLGAIQDQTFVADRSDLLEQLLAGKDEEVQSLFQRVKDLV